MEQKKIAIYYHDKASAFADLNLRILNSEFDV
jgi:hypothetical protein